MTTQGNHIIRPKPGSPRRIRRNDGIQTVIELTGPYSALMSSEPSPGSSYGGYPGEVDSVETYPTSGGSGEQVIRMSLDEPQGSTDTPTAPVYELEWVDVDKPLRSHPRYNGDAFNGAKITDSGDVEIDGETVNATLGDILDMILRKDLTSERKELIDLVQNPDHRALLNDILKKIFRGQESYTLPVPVARITTTTANRVATTAKGKIGPPPGFPDLPPGYEWLGTADRSRRQGRSGRWERTREWTGADEIDADLYENA